MTNNTAYTRSRISQLLFNSKYDKTLSPIEYRWIKPFHEPSRPWYAPSVKELFMNIVLANDHGAVELKNAIMAGLLAQGHTVENLGVNTADSVDYPDMATLAAARFLAGGFDFGIVCCGTGIGISIAANKIHGIRCALVHDLFTAEMSKRHNNANFLAFGGRVQYSIPVMDMIEKYITTEYEGGRHARRVGKLDMM
jgi:ribose 5-phosphate isomerase B